MSSIEFKPEDLDRSHIPIGEMRTIHKCPSNNKFYDIERGRKRTIGVTPFTNDWVMVVNGYNVSVFYCCYCSEKFG